MLKALILIGAIILIAILVCQMLYELEKKINSKRR